ncbi:MAG: DUF1028 domain-containing protein [Alphaproteobacteria bacterium]|nr:DUF1028 domain-containing protein [Alphaproteobacteria bacterium]
MTWSIVAHDPATGAYGVAVTTKFFAVGALCPHAMSGVGALSTQALVNPTLGPRGLRLLQKGVPAPEIVRLLLAEDEGRETRQLHVLDAKGRNAAHTGRECIDWAGHILRDGFSVAGNMLVGPAVIAETADFFAGHPELPFAPRLIGALDAGQAVGGDKRGKQSAALIIYTSEEYPALDLRVDDHAEPLVELRRLYEVAQGHFVPFMRFMPTREKPSGTWDRAVINEEVARVQAALKK